VTSPSPTPPPGARGAACAQCRSPRPGAGASGSCGTRLATPRHASPHDGEGLFARLAPEHGLKLREVALDSPAGRDLAARSGALLPPVAFRDGEPFSYGRLSERKLRRTLAASP
jgi:hypothetical protein